jgi:hypothetical protein
MTRSAMAAVAALGTLLGATALEGQVLPTSQPGVWTHHHRQ